MLPEDILRDAEANFKQCTDEAGFRGAASRAYIAAFQHIIRHPKVKEQFRPSQTGDDHRDLIDFLKRSSDEALKLLGTRMLPRLRALRNIADYNLEGHFTREMAVEALDEASEIIYSTLSL